MPIEVTTKIEIFDQETFRALNTRLLGMVFEVHNEFGRFLDEALYKSELAARWLAAGLGTVEREVQINVSHESFFKSYFLDVLFNHGLMLEAKVAEMLSPVHRAQGLNYLFLTGMKHAMLANLRPERVQYEFLSTQLTNETRRQFSLAEIGWREVNDESGWLRKKLVELLDDWGAFLEVGLYRDAITHFLGGPERVIAPVPVHFGERILGNQSVHLLTADTAFAFTALPAERATMEDHQRRFLKHTPLHFIQWINFNHHQIELTTLER
jgi:GxxExxY protein